MIVVRDRRGPRGRNLGDRRGSPPSRRRLHPSPRAPRRRLPAAIRPPARARQPLRLRLTSRSASPPTRRLLSPSQWTGSPFYKGSLTGGQSKEFDLTQSRSPRDRPALRQSPLCRMARRSKLPSKAPATVTLKTAHPRTSRTSSGRMTMAKDNSFDVVSEVDLQEVDNAFQQTQQGTGAALRPQGLRSDHRVQQGRQDLHAACAQRLRRRSR